MRGRLRSKGKVREGKHVGTARRLLTEAELAPPGAVAGQL